MTVLLDENIPRKLQWRVKERGIEAVTVPDRGWSGATNGELLSRTEEGFDALLTMDQGIQHQQNIQGRSLGIVTILAPNNEYDTLLPLMPKIDDALHEVEARQSHQCSFRENDARIWLSSFEKHHLRRSWTSRCPNLI